MTDDRLPSHSASLQACTQYPHSGVAAPLHMSGATVTRQNPTRMTTLKTLFTLLACVAAPSWAGPQIESWTTKQGARVYLVSTAAQPMVDVKIDFDAGEDRAERKQAGLAQFVASELLDYEFTGNDGELLTPNEKLRAIGAQFGSSSEADRASVYLRVLSSQKEAAVGILRKQLGDANFPYRFHDWRRSSWTDRLEADYGKRNKGSVATLAKLLYGEHPYANADVIGADTVDDLSNRDVLRFQRKHYIASNAVFSIVGNISRPEAERIVNEVVEYLPKGDKAAALDAPKLPAASPGKQIIVKHEDAAQSTLRLGLLLPPRSSADYLALQVGNHILGGGDMESKLMQEVRVNRGLAYSVYSTLESLRLSSELQLVAQTRRDQTNNVLAVMKQTLADFVANGPSDAELQAAKSYFRQRVPFWTESNLSTLELLSTIGYYQLPLSYPDDFAKAVDQLTREDVKAAWQRWVKPEQVAIVISGGQTGEAKAEAAKDGAPKEGVAKEGAAQ
ncbi:zinc protease [Andreprevotia lacus DSM 23236]|jgi:zinc protease|uniref:Zinc protease n=1 Tax=Andreprevotia lacus DSM 23236 TaxID=1121001 RepID=A0A1W1XX47_9NEIS|nr:pitrilysin family protein [Andreprevotia lacus]SMC28111.1 zinc protease [Andreprevotia lacus DSM 23236]